MNADPPRESSSVEETLVDKLVEAVEEAEEAGRELSVEEVCRDFPSLGDLLRQKLERRRRIDRLLKGSPAVNNEDELAVPAGPLVADSRYSGLQFHDAGGLGLVYRAVDDQLHRNVAVKFLKARHVEIPESVRLFRDEAEITGLLDHPGVVPIYASGSTGDGQPFYTMRLLQGRDLQTDIESFHSSASDPASLTADMLAFRRLLTSFVTVCKTIDYAHSRGVIHCDLKPRNVMIGAHGETVVLDWGMAQIVGRNEHYSDRTQGTLFLGDDRSDSGTRVRGGTPAYMSPEQYRPDGSLDAATDIYSLGAVLYCILTGQCAFETKNKPLHQIRAQVERGQFKRPRELKRSISPVLEAICLRAMQIEPSRRYRTAMELAEDVEAYLADEPVTALADTPSRKIARWMRRNRLFVQTVAVLLLVGSALLLAGLVGMSRMAEAERNARRAAIASRDDSLKLAASLAAQAVGIKQGDRYRVLEMESRLPELIDLLANRIDNPQQTDWARIQSVLEGIALKHQSAAAKSWFLCDAEGLQVARYPREESVGNDSFFHRDYFHGNGHDLSPGEHGSPRYITELHRSVVYRSGNDPEELKTAVTIPIWGPLQDRPGQRFLGVLGLSIGLNEFRELETSLGTDQAVLVVDLRTNNIDDVTAEGFVLHHPAVHRSLASRTPSIITKEALTRIKQLHESMRRGQALAESPVDMTSFRDPLAPADAEPVPAAFAPVFVPGRPPEIADLGWAIVVFSRSNP